MEKEVFVPLYLSNICHSHCSICNMRIQNSKMKRIVGSKERLEEQLKILYEKERINEICFLTGELTNGKQRKENLDFVIYAVERAFDYGYKRVFFNIGSLSDNEILKINQYFPKDDRLVLSLFQETYDETLYEKYFGSFDISNPKSDFKKRFSTPERWIEMGFRNVDLGVLLGLNPCAEKDIEALIEHAAYLRTLGANVFLSLPRIYRCGKIIQSISDEMFVRFAHQVKTACPWAKLIITTRESVPLIREMLPYIDVVSPGSSDVMPYTWEGDIPNDERTSQFQVAIKRKRPSEVLRELELSGW